MLPENNYIIHEHGFTPFSNTKHKYIFIPENQRKTIPLLFGEESVRTLHLPSMIDIYNYHDGNLTKGRDYK